MRAFTTFAAAALAGAASAQLTATRASSSSSSATATSSKSPAVHTVTVGKGGFSFEPLNTQADLGDIITFQFWPANHSVVRSDYKYPCIPYEDLGPNRTGFYSGFKIVGDSSAVQTWNLTVTTTDPQWYYCSHPDSCRQYGMIGVINNNNASQISDQIQRAKNAAFMLQPGEPYPAENQSLATSQAAAAATATVTLGATPSASTSPAAAAAAPTSSSLGGGAIAGIVIGALVVLAIAGALFYFIGRSRSLSQTLKHNSNNRGGGGGAMSEAGSWDPSHGGGTLGHTSSIVGGSQARHWSGPTDFSGHGAWSNQHGLPTYAAAAELKSGPEVDIGSVRSSSPPTRSPYTPNFPPSNHPSTGAPFGGVSPPMQQGEWVFQPSGRQTLELGAGGQALNGGGGHFAETGLGVHELDAHRNSVLREAPDPASRK